MRAGPGEAGLCVMKAPTAANGHYQSWGGVLRGCFFFPGVLLCLGLNPLRCSQARHGGRERGGWEDHLILSSSDLPCSLAAQSTVRRGCAPIGSLLHPSVSGMTQCLRVLNHDDSYEFRDQRIPDFYNVPDGFCLGDRQLQ